MPRTAATLDVFRAVAEPQRRHVLMALMDGERSVNELVEALRWRQPQVSKQLGVLRQARLVGVRRAGRRRIYHLNGQNLKPLHDWAAKFESFWQHQLDRIKAKAEAASQWRTGS